MKKLLLILLFGGFYNVYAQLYVSFGGLLKPHFASIQGMETAFEDSLTTATTRSAFRGAGGITAELGFNQYVGLQTGIWYVAEGGKVDIETNSQTTEVFYKFNALKIPLYLRIGEGIAAQKTFFSAYIGPQFVLAGNRSVLVNGVPLPQDSTLNLLKSNYLEISGRIQLDVPVSKYSTISLAMGGDYAVSDIYQDLADEVDVNPLNFGFYIGFTQIIALKSLRKAWF